MSSPEHQPYTRLDATRGRTIVYCHLCACEWHRDDYGLICPDCSSEATEIVTEDTDPRDSEELHAPGMPPRIAPRPYHQSLSGDDSDPEEADIEEHMEHETFINNAETRSGPDDEHFEPTIHNMFQHLFGMIQNLTPDSGQEGQRRPGEDPFGHANNFHRQTFHGTFGGGGTASVTIVSAPSSMMGGSAFRGMGEAPSEGRGEGRMDASQGDSFQAVFSNILRDMDPQGQTGSPPHFIGGLADLISRLQPANGVAGDAVYSQEALDRIITGLLDAHPPSNGAPPASEAALSKLERKTIDKEMIGDEGKTDCSICLDDLVQGQTGAILPCKHWFHEHCVIEWLKAHNTCPVCRTPVEKDERQGRRRRNGNNDDNDGHNHGGDSARDFGFPDDETRSPWGGSRSRPGSSPRGTSQRWSDGHANNSESDASNPVPPLQFFGPFVYQQRPRMYDRHNSRMNEAMRNLSHHQQRQRRSHGERERERDRERSQTSTTSGFSYDTSNLQRRPSMSPTSPLFADRAGWGVRHRQRSPSFSRRTQDEDRRHSQGGNGPLGWLRDRFSGRPAGSRDAREGRDDRRN